MVTGIDDIVLESNILINDPTAETVDASITFSNTTTTYNISPIYTSDVYFGSNDESYTIFENSSMNVTPNLPCSSSGTTVINFSLGNYNGMPIPFWVSINSSTGKLTINSPEVSVDTDAYFYVNSKFTGTPKTVIEELWNFHDSLSI